MFAVKVRRRRRTRKRRELLPLSAGKAFKASGGGGGFLSLSATRAEKTSRGDRIDAFCIQTVCLSVFVSAPLLSIPTIGKIEPVVKKLTCSIMSQWDILKKQNVTFETCFKGCCLLANNK